MPVSFDLPVEVERSLRRDLGDLDGAAKEAALVELYRQQKLSHCELAQALGLSRDETDGVLKKHHVTEDSPSLEEFRAELDFLDHHRKA
jgi:hypothetical protein